MSLTTEKALMPAILGSVFRLGASRVGYVNSNPILVIGGQPSAPVTGSPLRVLWSSLSISDQLNEAPNTATFSVQGIKPLEGQEVVIAFGTRNGRRQFAGHIIRVTQVYLVQVPKNIVWHVEAIDYTWRFNQRIAYGRYRNQSASVIAADLLTKFAPVGYNGAGIQANLPVVDEISFDNGAPLMEAFAQLAGRIGGYARVDYYKSAWLFTTESGLQVPTKLTAAHPTMMSINYERDLSQVVTRAIVEGGGAGALGQIVAGQTRIPVADAVWYNPTGGMVKAGPQRLTYTGVVTGGSGSLVGPGVTPTAPPTAQATAGPGIDVGVHSYAYTWVTASGETLPSPLASVTHGDMAPPTQPPYLRDVNKYQGTSGYTIGETIYWCHRYSAGSSEADGTAETDSSPVSAPWVVPSSNIAGYAGIPNIAFPYSPPIDPRIKYVHLFELRAGVWRWVYSHSVASWTWDTAYGTWGPGQTTLPIPNPQVRRTSLSGIAVGPAAVTARRVYRTQVGGSQLKLVVNLGDNATTSYLDAAADAALGANAPTSGDTSGLTQPTGQVPVGATSMIVASTGPFGPSGYARAANQIIRYTGVSGNSLVGIPALGDGAVLSAIPYNSPVVVAPQITGIPASGAGSIVLTIAPGDNVNLLIIADDLVAQGALAALIGSGDTGVREAVDIDQRISETEARARAQALLAQSSKVLETLTYTVKDPSTVAGALVSAAIVAPTSIAGDFRLQDVTITGFSDQHLPTWTATASSRRFTLEDLLRRARANISGA
jgi:hypothetical protein